MKFSLVFATVLLLFSVSRATKVEEQKTVQESIFQRTFRQQHREPLRTKTKSAKNVETLWITQKLDNFNYNDNRTWNMRYLANGELYQSGGPLFIFVGGEWEITLGSITSGHWYDMAKEHNGYLFYTEHRYYGQSIPTSDVTIENLQYLNVHQALADLAHFIRTMKATIPGMSNSKVFLAGGSYSATMVAWFKKLYPDLATGCWASSGPLYAKVDFYEYKEITGQSIRLISGDACYNRIQNAIAEMEFMLANQRGAEVEAILKICNNFDESNDLDVYTLFEQISSVIAGVVQYHDNGKIEAACNIILKDDSDLGGLAKYLVSVFGSISCIDLSYNAKLDILMDSSYSNDSNYMRQWIYQTCNEFGWYQTSGSTKQPFGSQFPVDLYLTMCADVFGKKFSEEFINQQAAETNKQFGGLSPGVENVYTTQGQLDPWRAVGIQNGTMAAVIPRNAHCEDFGSISPKDSAALRASKEKIASLIREWMK